MNVNFKNYKDSRGELMPIPFKDVPFAPVRTFIVHNVPKNMVRGRHAHYKTKQFLICVKGCIEVLLDDGLDKHTIILNVGESCLIDKGIWDEQKFLTGEDVLLVLCSTEYDPWDYIHDYEEYLTYIKYEF
jgi:UDP-2-acetamido-3-amino-2,3-dideoxy-glucuronate N-acetyltransferase